MGKILFENIFRSNEVSFNDEGIAVCPYCNGTGLNDEFKLFNKVMEKLYPSVNACCLKCYGKKQADWVEFMNGRIDDIMEYLYHDCRQIHPECIENFIYYVYNGCVIHRGQSGQIRYNEKTDQWEEIKDEIVPGIGDKEEEVLRWINAFKDNYFFELVELPDLSKEYYDPDFDSLLYFAAQIRIDILNAANMKIEDLQRMKENLELFGFTIDVLNEVDIIHGAIYSLSDFEFTWENLLKRFDIPHIHGCPAVSKGVLLFD